MKRSIMRSTIRSTMKLTAVNKVVNKVAKKAVARKTVAGLLALLILRVSVAGAASLSPGSVAVLEPAARTPQMRAAWDQVERQLYLDPLLLVKGKEQVAGMLKQWEQSGAAIESSHLTAYRSAMNRSEKIMANAWDAYYGFEYEKALELLAEMEKLISIPGDTALRADMAFERFILEGMVLSAMERKGYRASFASAAALDLDRELPVERYSPQTVRTYTKILEEVSKRPKGTLQVSGSPDDTSVMVNGKHVAALNETVELSEGDHYLELKAPGYEPWYTVAEVDRYAPVNIVHELVPGGPTGDPNLFFLDRLRAGDRAYLSQLVSRLDVDYVIIPDAQESAMGAWLLDRDGRTVDHKVIWESGDGLKAAMGPMEAMVGPLRQSWSSQSEQSSVTLPEAGPIPEHGATDWSLSGWRKYALVVGAVLILGAASSPSESGGTRVEVTW
jgi:hypothetical protein